MSIKSGQRYKITNEQTKLAVDLSGVNNKSILGYSVTGAENQQWVLEKQGDGQWTVQSVRGQKYLGFEGSPDNGTPLLGLDKPQLWDIEIIPDSGDQAKLSVKLGVPGTSYIVDFPTEKQTSGTDLQLWKDWDEKNQVWVLEECAPRLSEVSIKSGQRYKITNEHTKLVVDLSGTNNKSILGYSLHGGTNQQWVLEKQGDGKWTIRSVRGQKYLGFEGTPDNGTRLVGLDKPQLWDIETVPGSKDLNKPTVKISVPGTSYVVDFPPEKQVVGAELQLWKDWDGRDQVWLLEEYESREVSIKSGQRYKITNEKTKLVFDLSGTNGKSILGYSLHGGTNQQWVLEKQGDGQWTIRSVRSQKYLGFESTPDNGTRLVGLDKPQLWDIETIPGNKDQNKPSVKISVRGTSFVADLPPERQVAGAELQLWKDWDGRNQVWVLEQYA